MERELTRSRPGRARVSLRRRGQAGPNRDETGPGAGAPKPRAPRSGLGGHARVPLNASRVRKRPTCGGKGRRQRELRDAPAGKAVQAFWKREPADILGRGRRCPGPQNNGWRTHHITAETAAEDHAEVCSTILLNYYSSRLKREFYSVRTSFLNHKKLLTRAAAHGVDAPAT
jgi:hypothetical protein